MKIMSGIRLVIADVDGTLVNDHRELSSYTKSVIERLHEQEFCLVLPPAEIIFNCWKIMNTGALAFLLM